MLATGRIALQVMPYPAWEEVFIILPYLCSLITGLAYRVQKKVVEVGLYHRVPLLAGHVVYHPVSRNAGVVHQDINATKAVDSSLNDALSPLLGGYRLVAGNRYSTGASYLFDYLIGRLFRALPAI